MLMYVAKLTVNKVHKVHEHIIKLPLQIQGENKNKLKAIQI